MYEGGNKIDIMSYAEAKWGVGHCRSLSCTSRFFHTAVIINMNLLCVAKLTIQPRQINPLWPARMPGDLPSFSSPPYSAPPKRSGTAPDGYSSPHKTAAAPRAASPWLRRPGILVAELFLLFILGGEIGDDIKGIWCAEPSLGRAEFDSRTVFP